MRKYILTILICCVALANTNAQQQCIITSPAAASSWTGGNTMLINWNAGAFTSNVNINLIDYSINIPYGQNVATIATNISNSGSFSFLIPTSLPTKCTYGVYVENVSLPPTNWCYGPSNVCIINTAATICCPQFSLKQMGNIRACQGDSTCRKDEYHPPNGGNPVGISIEKITSCKNSEQTYYVFPNLPGFSFNWTVTGGTPTSFTGNPAIITWGNGTNGTIQVIISDLSGNCRDTITQKVCLLNSPVAAFTIAPSATVCAGQTPIIFTNTSTGATTWSWDFGDGTGSVLQNPPPHLYNTPGTYPVLLTVTNSSGGGTANGESSCGCSNTASVVITVINGTGPSIVSSCKKMLCPKDTATYCVTTGCAPFNWTVNGGTIINNTGNCITVQWNATPPAILPASVSVTTGCGGVCGNGATLNVPVLWNNMPISGPNPVCVGASGTYSLPVMPGTFYTWAVSGGGGTIVGPNQNTATINVQWNSVGTATITCNYNNPYSGCSGSTTMTVNVRPQFNATGPSPVCTGTPQYYSITGGGLANWTISPNTGYTVGSTTSVTGISVSWAATGNYTLTATAVPPIYCNPSALINVLVNPAPVLNPIFGPATICANQLYNYTASSNNSGGNYTWNFAQGTGTISPFGADNSAASVIFTGTGPWTLQATQTVNGCNGSATVTINALPVPVITATVPTTVCIGGTVSVSVSSGTGPFTWSTSPMASLINGQGTINATYEIHGIGTITVSNCSGISNTVTVSATLPPPITITPTGSLCTGNLQLSAPLGTSYQWSGSSVATTQIISVTIPGTYTVVVTSLGGCKSVASFTVAPVPIPTVTISTGNATIWCNPATPSVTMYAFTLGVGCTYQWYRNGTPIVGATLAMRTATLAGIYYVVVTCSGCIATSNTINVQQINCDPTPGCASPVPPNPLGVISIVNCNPKIFSIPVTGCPGGVVTWNFGDGNTATGNPVNYTYVNAGMYGVTASITCNGCTFTANSYTGVPVKASFNSSVVCGINGNKTITFNNTSQVLGGWNINSVKWTSTCGSPLTGTGNTFILNTTIGCSPTVTMIIDVRNNMTNQSCKDTIALTFTLPAASLVINGSSSTVCKNQPATFTSSLITGIVQYAWTVNGIPVSQNNPLIYTFSGTPTNNMVGLTVTDAYGCKFTKLRYILVKTPPALTITPSPLVKICQDCPPVPTILNTSPATGFVAYQWYHNGSAISGATSSTYSVCPGAGIGNYYVTATSVSGANGPCPVRSDTVNVVYHPKPIADIQGSSIACYSGGVAYINLYNSINAAPGTTYVWTYQGNNTSLSNVYNLSTTVNATGNYSYVLTATSASGCIARDTICVVVANSPVVSVTAPATMCAGTLHTFIATATPPNLNYIYQWSNGVMNDTMSTSLPGMYFVTVINPLNGCSGTAFAGIVQPRPSAILFPVGCDTLCNFDSIIPPLAVGGPIVAANYTVQWFLNGNYATPIYTGPVLNLLSNIPPLVYGINNISIVVTYNGCSDTSNAYNLFIKKCDSCDCKESHWGEITLQSGGATQNLSCDKTYDLKCNQPFTFNAAYNCKDSACTSKVTYSLQPPSGPAITGTIPPAFTYTPTLNGIYTLTMSGWCDTLECNKCVIKFVVKCNPDKDCCKGSKWGEKTVTIDNVTKSFICEKNEAIDVKCKVPITINANFNCAKEECASTVTYVLTSPSGTSSGNLPLTFTPNLTGTYTLVLYGYCGGVVCDSCVINFKTECVETCCPYEIKAKTGTVKYDYVQIPNATLAAQTFTINGLALANITEVRANVISYTIDDNYKKECIKCVNLPFTWASVSSATKIGTVPGLITMYGGTPVASFNGSGAGAYQNPREVVWNNGSPISIPSNTNIGINFILPPVPGIDCCVLEGEICVKFTFRDIDCKECEVIACYKFLIKKE